MPAEDFSPLADRLRAARVYAIFSVIVAGLWSYASLQAEKDYRTFQYYPAMDDATFERMCRENDLRLPDHPLATARD